ncbi:DNA damage-inducible transcript 4-like protein isoform X3 [Vulpes vulpes]|uniref:DNA damage-inducible transcript 4-like protein n=1 Tax=Vulpes vulpes TaxID=9627 RepID=A0ABM5AA71_VULVU
MVATGSLSSKNSANISELLDHGFHPGSLLNDFDYWDYVVPEPNLNEVIFEETTCQSLAKMLENCLSKSKQTKLGCSKVLVPEKLTQRIAQDVLRLSSTEPCGLRGCVMHVNLEIENVGKMRKLLSIFTIHWSRAMLRTKNHSNEGAWMSQWLSVFLPSAQGLI